MKFILKTLLCNSAILQIFLFISKFQIYIYIYIYINIDLIYLQLHNREVILG